MCERALEKFHFSSNLCSFIVLFSSNDMLKWNMRVSASGIVIFLEFDSFSLHFTQISLNSLNFWIISFSFLKFPWNSLNFWNSLKNSLRRSKFLRFRYNKENSLKVEALCESVIFVLIQEYQDGYFEGSKGNPFMRCDLFPAHVMVLLWIVCTHSVSPTTHAPSQLKM